MPNVFVKLRAECLNESQLLIGATQLVQHNSRVQADVLLVTSLTYALFFSKQTSKICRFLFPVGKVASPVQTHTAVVSPLTFFLFQMVEILSHTIWNSFIGRNVSSVSLGSKHWLGDLVGTG